MPIGGTTILADLNMEPVAATDGVPLGIDGYDGYRFVIQLAIVTPANILPFKLGTSQLGGPRWKDITGDCQGVEWSRGGSPSQRPIAGELSFRLLNPDGLYSPWASRFYGPGAMVRVAVGNGTFTLVQFCGMVQSWGEGSIGLYAYAWVDVVAWETMALLSEVNDHALASPVGAADTFSQRVWRILDRADWQFDANLDWSGSPTFQATDHAADALTELYNVVDSVDVTVYPGKDGKLRFVPRAEGTGVDWVLDPGDLNPDSLITANDDERILSSVDLARVGGTSVTYTNSGLAARYQRRSTNRTNLKTVAEAGDADLARVASGILARARQTYRAIAFEVVASQNPAVAGMILEADLTDRLTLVSGEVSFVSYSMCGFAHALQVKQEGVHWVTTISLDIEADSGWYRGTPTPALVGTARVGQTRVGFV